MKKALFSVKSVDCRTIESFLKLNGYPYLRCENGDETMWKSALFTAAALW